MNNRTMYQRKCHHRHQRHLPIVRHQVRQPPQTPTNLVALPTTTNTTTDLNHVTTTWHTSTTTRQSYNINKMYLWATLNQSILENCSLVRWETLDVSTNNTFRACLSTQWNRRKHWIRRPCEVWDAKYDLIVALLVDLFFFFLKKRCKI